MSDQHEADHDDERDGAPSAVAGDGGLGRGLEVRGCVDGHGSPAGRPPAPAPVKSRRPGPPVQSRGADSAVRCRCQRLYEPRSGPPLVATGPHGGGRDVVVGRIGVEHHDLDPVGRVGGGVLARERPRRPGRQGHEREAAQGARRGPRRRRTSRGRGAGATCRRRSPRRRSPRRCRPRGGAGWCRRASHGRPAARRASSATRSSMGVRASSSLPRASWEITRSRRTRPSWATACSARCTWATVGGSNEPG